MHRALSLFAAAVVMLVSAKASAAFHIMKIVQVHAGSAAAPNAQYVQLQLYAAGQNLVSGHTISFYDGAGVEIAASKFTFPANVANAADRANILIGTASVLTTFGVAPDFTLPANLPQAGGAVCFETIDCFTWGTFPGAAADTTTTPCLALTTGLAARRKTGGADTANSAADWELASPTPTNNLGVSGGVDGGTSMISSCAPAGVDSGTPGVDSGTPAVDSGITTVPTPPGPGAGTVRVDSGTAAAAPAEDDSGCNAAARSSEGWSTTLGLGAAAAIFVLSRRRRSKR